MEELKTFRGIHQKEIEKSGHDLLSAIEHGLLTCDPNWKPVKSGQNGSNEVPQVLNFVQTYIASNHQNSSF
jgi:hypothetical protein